MHQKATLGWKTPEFRRGTIDKAARASALAHYLAR
jgi:hypothetical protein